MKTRVVVRARQIAPVQDVVQFLVGSRHAKTTKTPISADLTTTSGRRALAFIVTLQRPGIWLCFASHFDVEGGSCFFSLLVSVFLVSRKQPQADRLARLAAGNKGPCASCRGCAATCRNFPRPPQLPWRGAFLGRVVFRLFLSPWGAIRGFCPLGLRGVSGSRFAFLRSQGGFCRFNFWSPLPGLSYMPLSGLGWHEGGRGHVPLAAGVSATRHNFFRLVPMGRGSYQGCMRFYASGYPNSRPTQ